MTVRWISVVALMVALNAPVRGQSKGGARFPLVASGVAQSLSVNGVKIEGQQVSLLAKVVATEPNPMLDVVSVVRLGDRSSNQPSGIRSLVKLACHLPGVCVPFYAIVSWPDGSVGNMAGLLNASDAAGKDALKPSAAFTIRAGAHATMVLDDDRAHIQVAVISLENGVAGHKIRVASPDHKQIYVAEVVSANLLKGSF
jgi:hypothetical protein